jgi:4-diphosphocytidyl-2-C-methyl-D-erythritol kinase
MPTTLRSHAKINLGLYIGAPRPDGFHSLVTVYQTLEAHDLVTVSARVSSATSIRLTSNDERVPADNRNTAWKMVDLALGAMGVSAQIEVHIEKRLPVQGGLGAGSANAVAALIGLEAELSNQGTEDRDWDRWLAQRLDLAAQVGSDVPLFLIGGTVLGIDRGQEVYPLPDLESMWCVLALPEVGVSTPQAFRDWDELCAKQGLTPEASDGKLKQLSRAYASAFAVAEVARSSGVLSQDSSEGANLAGTQGSALVRTGITRWIENDFEQVVFRQQPSLLEIKRILAATGTPEAACHPPIWASLSGSGSALFGLYKAGGDAEAAQGRLKAEFGETVRSTLTRTLPRAEYWRGMIQRD